MPSPPTLRSEPPSNFRRRRHPGARTALVIAAAITGDALSATAHAAPPEIRLHGANRVPACVTPERLMAFLKTRNSALENRFEGIAKWYRHHGEAWRVRWDYAFFQMAIETNFLTYRRPDGRQGDVSPRQNNFAGIGTTGGGVPGDRFPDVKTGVLAQIQHLVAYSGEPIAAPVAPRTALKQGDIVAASRALGRAVRFSDLARRWAVDPRYGHSIEFIAETFRRQHCNDGSRANGRETLPWRRSSSFDHEGQITAPAPAPAVRPRQIVRTIWRRGDPTPTAVASFVAQRVPPASTPATADATTFVAPVDHNASVLATETATTRDVKPDIDTSLRSGLLGSLAAMAQSMEMPIVAPAPRLALRTRTEP